MKKKTNLWAGSHLPVLIYLMLITAAIVLEMRVGYTSTPVLHWLCFEQGRNLLSLENDRKWLEKFLEYEDNFHTLKFTEDWDRAPIDNQHWSIVLIDHRPALRRRIDAKRLKDNADYIILHDSEPEINKFYRYTDIYTLFKYRYDYTRTKPYTTVLSNFKDLSELRRRSL